MGLTYPEQEYIGALAKHGIDNVAISPVFGYPKSFKVTMPSGHESFHSVTRTNWNEKLNFFEDELDPARWAEIVAVNVRLLEKRERTEQSEWD